MSTANHRLAQIAGYVQAHLHEAAEKFPSREHNPVYRWQHTLRVAAYGRQIAEAERADVDAVIAACLLHDVAHFESDADYRSHGRLGAQMARPLLESLGYTASQVDNICYSIAVHVDGEAGYAHEHTLEARLTSDADNIDRFGAYRVILWCLDDDDRLGDYEQLITRLSQRLQRLEHYRQNNPLETEAGRALFARQLDLQINFFRELIAEHRLTRLPEFGDE